MTTVTSRIVTPGSRPIAGVHVYATMVASTAAMRDGSGSDERVEGYSDRDGRWTLDLPPASEMVDTSAFWTIREVGHDAFVVRVPADPGHPVEASTAGDAPPPDDGSSGDAPLPDDPSTQGSYVRRSELGAPDGVAELDHGGVLVLNQLPPAATEPPRWFSGHGAPGVVTGARRGDMYLDLDNGELHRLA